jgi:hypothetical protein
VRDDVRCCVAWLGFRFSDGTHTLADALDKSDQVLARVARRDRFGSRSGLGGDRLWLAPTLGKDGLGRRTFGCGVTDLAFTSDEGRQRTMADTSKQLARCRHGVASSVA